MATNPCCSLISGSRGRIFCPRYQPMPYLTNLIICSMDYLEQLEIVMLNIEELMVNPQFFDKLAGEDQSFLDTTLDFFERITAELDPASNKEVPYDPTWQIQQDAETD